MPGNAKVAVKGYHELVRSFDRMQGKLKSEVRQELVAVGEPARSAAQSLAIANVRNIGEDWSQMRLGITSALVYVAPRARSRRRGSRRPNLAVLLLERSMLPAVRKNEPAILAGLDRMLGRLAGEEGWK